MKKNFATVTLCFIVALWGLSFSLTKPLLENMGVFNFLAFRFVIGGFVLSLVLIVKKRFSFNKQILTDGIIAGLLLFIVFFFHTLGLKYTTIPKNAFIVGSGVIFIPFIKIILYKERQNRTTWLQVVFATLGLAFITLIDASGGLNIGDILSIIGTIIVAYYTIFIEKKIQKHDALTFTAIQLQTIGVLSLVGMFALETPTLPVSTLGWISVLLLGVLLTGIAYVLVNVCQSRLDSLTVSIIYTLEPFFAALFGWILLSEAIGTNTVYGGILIFISMLIPTLHKRFNQKPELAANKA